MKFQFHSDYRYWELAIAAINAANDSDREAIWSQWDFVGSGDPKMTGAVQCGYYKRKLAGNWVPVHIGKLNGSFVERTGQAVPKPMPDTLEAWTWLVPVAYADYQYAFEHGRFPGEVDEAPVALDHNAFDPGSELRDKIATLIGTIALYLKSCDTPPNDLQANTLANYLTLVRDAATKANEALAAETAEMNAKVHARRVIWARSVDAAKDMVETLRDRLKPWFSQRPGTEAKLGGQHGNRISLRPKWAARVDDWELVYPQFSEHPDVRAAILKALNANARSKEREQLFVYGATYYQEETVA